MKYRNKLLLLPLMLALFVVSCKEQKKETKEQPAEETATEFERRMSAEDTTAVEELVDKFFGYVLDKQYYEAAGMLYRNDADKDQEPELLDNEALAEVTAMLESIPMVGYQIDYIKFSEYYSNEVLCRVIIREAEGDMPAITTKMYFKPVNYLGNWVLCLTNTAYGDKGLIKENVQQNPSAANRKGTMSKDTSLK